MDTQMDTRCGGAVVEAGRHFRAAVLSMALLATAALGILISGLAACCSSRPESGWRRPSPGDSSAGECAWPKESGLRVRGLVETTEVSPNVPV